MPILNRICWRCKIAAALAGKGHSTMTNTELFDLWRAARSGGSDLLTELDGIRVMPMPSMTAFTATWPLARAVCAASSAQAATA